MQLPTLERSITLPIAEVDHLCDVIGGLPSDVDAMGPIDAVRKVWVGEGLLTVNLNVSPPEDVSDVMQLERIWTSNASAYPVGGRKRKTLTPWTRKLFVDGGVFKAEGVAAMSEAFDDYATMAGLGLHSALNVPLLENDVCVGTFNCMSVGHTWAPRQITVIRLLALLAKPWILRQATSRRTPAVSRSEVAR